MAGTLIANGNEVPVELPCTLEQFLISQNQSPRSVVVELNGEAVTPSDFATRELAPNDRLEIVRIVAGG
ncbi:MAG TPA: sulfur carrier protein ThiS [Verrucomicrobiales bacterium]|nr:sulfur carrier protein ThiS [Verrucomicrobiales bacterium]HIL24169.1 sulfur carrier protein ThiS [Verrucomicrobiota bacterium]